MREENIADASISDCWAEDWDFVLVAPVVYALFVVDFLAETLNDLAWSPSDAFLHLLLVHFLEKWQQELFQLDVALVSHQDVSDPAVSIQSVLNIIHIELSKMEAAHALHQIFLNSTSSGDNAVDHLMLSQVSNDFSHSTRGHVGSISKEDSASCLCSVCGVTGFFIISFVEWLIRESPADHAVDDFDGLVQMSGLEAHGGKAIEEFLIVDSLVEIIALDYLGMQLFVLMEELTDLLLHQLGRHYLRFTTHC